jgi:glycosyltransferase involved in cell wall biosynthesis
MKKRLLIVTEAGSAWPSGVVRAIIYKDLFRSYGIHVDYVSRQSQIISRLLLSHGVLLERLLNTGLSAILERINSILARAKERLIVWVARKDYDVIFLQKVRSLDLIAKLRKIGKARLVFDVNDGLWLPANSSYANGGIREILRLVDAVTCDNRFGLAFSQDYNSNTFLVPDPSQVEMFDQYRISVRKPRTPLIIGWIGTSGTLFNLFAIWEALENIFSSHKNILLRIIGAGYNRSLLPRFEQVRYEVVPYYSRSDMMAHVLGMNIGLFPLFDVEDSRARGILKATIFMSGEAAVIASPRGQVPELIQDGVNGMLANSTEEWIDRLDLLITNNTLRERIAAAGLETVRRDFSIDKTFECLLTALDLTKS